MCKFAVIQRFLCETDIFHKHGNVCFTIIKFHTYYNVGYIISTIINMHILLLWKSLDGRL
jgi:hypothetical protein